MNYQQVPQRNEAVKVLNRMIVPTLDEDVRAMLRSLNEPVTYFGEDKADRRQRLIKLVNELPNTDFGDQFEVEEQSDEETGDEDDLEDEEFYTPGAPELLETRKSILSFSLEQARQRRKLLEEEYEGDFIKVLKHRRKVNENISKYQLYGTQLIPNNQRAISTIRYNANCDKIACGSWDGNLYILDKEMNLLQRLTPGYHTEKVSGLSWNNESIVTGGAEGNINYWDFKNTTNQMVKPSKTIKAHDARITKTLVHPNKQTLISTSFDMTWKLWDYETGKELMQQEGHLKEVFSAEFQTDGGILSTGGLDSVIKLWDMRSGKLINSLTSHTQGIYSLSWRHNGYHLASASGDSSVKIWDIRKMTNDLSKPPPELYSIPAHQKLVSDIKFYNCSDINIQKLSEVVTDENEQNPRLLSCNGTFLVSSSYDGTLKLWSADNWIQVAQLTSTDKVMGCDISNNGTTIISSHWDKSVKLWCIDS